MRCYHCMTLLNQDTVRCPACGKPAHEKNPPHHLAAGTILCGKFLVGNAIGEGGFGITYVGYDKTLRLKVAIKEFFPTGFANRNHTVSNHVSLNYSKQGEYFKNGKANFMREAQSIAKFSNERGIVDVREYFEENNTAYIVMEYLDGVNLGKYITERSIFSAEKIVALLIPVMQSLEKMHAAGIIHRDISPDNIIYMRNGSLKLTDFGSARYFSTDEKTKSLSVVLKPGYAPYEQYGRKSGQGPWTDVYALCATIYKCITGVTPLDAFSRNQKDELPPPSEAGAKLSPEMEAVIMRGLAVGPEQRYQTVGELIADAQAALAASDHPHTIVFQNNKDKEASLSKTVIAEGSGEPPLPPAPPEDKNITYGDSKDFLKILSEEKRMERLRAPLPSSEYPPVIKKPDAAPPKAASGSNTRAVLKAIIATLSLLLAVIIAAQVITVAQRRSSSKKTEASQVSAAKEPDYSSEIRAAAAKAKTIACSESEFILLGNSGKASYYNIYLYSLSGTRISRENDALINNEHLTAISGNSRIGYYGLRDDGSVVTIKKVVETRGSRFTYVEKFGADIVGWNDITSITSGTEFLAALKEDGTVVTAGDAPDVSSWSDIIDIAAGGGTLAGLTKDGVVRYSDTEMGWYSVASVCDGDPSFCIKTDGTLCRDASDLRYSEADGWSNILTVSESDGNLVALTRDHTAVAIGSNQKGQCDISGWSELAVVKTTPEYTIGQKTDGTYLIACTDNDLSTSFDEVVNGVAPSSTAPASARTYRVQFINYDGSLIEEQEVEEGKAARAPATPTRPEDKYYRYRFTGWSQNFSRVTSDMIIFPVFEPISKSG